jgi:hypothetical protein
LRFQRPFQPPRSPSPGGLVHLSLCPFVAPPPRKRPVHLSPQEVCPFAGSSVSSFHGISTTLPASFKSTLKRSVPLLAPCWPLSNSPDSQHSRGLSLCSTCPFVRTPPRKRSVPLSQAPAQEVCPFVGSLSICRFSGPPHHPFVVPQR